MKKTTAMLAMTLGLAIAGAAYAQQKTMSIGTGGTGGVYYPLGGAVANVLSKNLPNVQATAEVTGGSVDNLKLIGAGKDEPQSHRQDGCSLLHFCLLDRFYVVSAGRSGDRVLACHSNTPRPMIRPGT